MEGLRGGEFVQWIKGNNGLWCFSWNEEGEGVVFSSCREQNEKNPPWVKKGKVPLNEGTLMIFVVPLLCSFPTSRRGIRLKADVASCSFLVQPSWPWPASYHPYLSETLDITLTSSSISFFTFFLHFFIYIFFEKGIKQNKKIKNKKVNKIWLKWKLKN